MRPRPASFLDPTAALATPVGRSALALLRMSGPETRRILAAVAPELAGELTARGPRLVSFFVNTGGGTPRGPAPFFSGPPSSPGEDVGHPPAPPPPPALPRPPSLLLRP